MSGGGVFFEGAVAVLVLLVLACAVLQVRERLARLALEQRVGATEATLAVLPGDTAASAASLAALRQRVETLENASRSLNARLLQVTEKADGTAVLVAQAHSRVEQHQETLVALHETLGRALGGFKGLAVHSGPEHTPDLYVASRQNVAGVPKETWRCHACAYREVRDASGTERTDLARPPAATAPLPPEGGAPQTGALTPTATAPGQDTGAATTHGNTTFRLVATGEGLIDAMRRRT